MIKVENMTSNRGNKIANQFIITHLIETGYIREYFQSYKSMIAMRSYYPFDTDLNKNQVVFLDPDFWNYSRTTSKYLNQFLGLTSKEIKLLIDADAFEFRNLNS